MQRAGKVKQGRSRRRRGKQQPNNSDPEKLLLITTNKKSPELCQSRGEAGRVPQTPAAGSEISPSIDAKSGTLETFNDSPAGSEEWDEQQMMKHGETRIPRLLEALREFSSAATTTGTSKEQEKHPVISTAALLKLSFDEENRNTLCTLGTIHALVDLILVDERLHGPVPADDECILMRRYSCMTLTNLTLGNSVNKTLLCTFKDFLKALVAQLDIENEESVQVTASLLRNLSWRTDPSSRAALCDVEAASALMKAAMRATKEGTWRVILSALWNLSAHSDANKAAICSTPTALQFLAFLLKEMQKPYSMPILESAGGILKNLSAHVAGSEEHRKGLRDCGCYETLLENLKSPSQAIVANCCGILGNLSGRPEEQRKLLQLNALPLLKSLADSKNEQIRQGANAALRNILSFQASSDFLSSQEESSVRKRAVESASDETFNYANFGEQEEDKEEEEDECDALKPYYGEGATGFSGSLMDTLFEESDTMLSFETENTPVIFSRTSSLSSIDDAAVEDSDEEDEEEESGGEEATVEDKKPSPVAGALGGPLPKRFLQNADETPLMFSRSSSVGSLASYGDLNNVKCESDAVSEIRSESDIQSCSDLPDSPRAVDLTASGEPVRKEPDFVQAEASERTSKRNSSSLTDEVKVYAVEGTPFLISTSTSLSDIVGELETQTATGLSKKTRDPPPDQVTQTEEQSIPNNLDPDDPSYSDVQLLQKCIRVGRGLGMANTKESSKPHPPEEEEIDLSSLIQRGRAQSLTRPEDVFSGKQCTSSSNTTTTTTTLPPLSSLSSSSAQVPEEEGEGTTHPHTNSETTTFPLKQVNLGSLPPLSLNQRFANISLNNIFPSTTTDLQQSNNKKTPPDPSHPTTTTNDSEVDDSIEKIVAATNDLRLSPFPVPQTPSAEQQQPILSCTYPDNGNA